MDNKENNTPLSGERVPQVKSVEDQLKRIKNIIAVDNGYSDWAQFLRVDPDCALDTIDTVCLVFSECRSIPPQSRISELESENAKLREALGSLKQFMYNEIIERRDYSASKAYEVVLSKLDELLLEPPKTTKIRNGLNLQ